MAPKLLQKHLQPGYRYEYGGKITLAVALKLPTSLSSVFSNRALTIRAEASLLRVTSLQLMIGVLMTLAALMISLIRGTPSVTFMDATPAKWKVLSVICVPGSPIDCAPTAPTVEPMSFQSSIEMRGVALASPGSMRALTYLTQHR